MVKIKGWELNKQSGMSRFTTIWQKSDGIIGGIQNNTKYPFLVVTRQGDGYAVRLITYSQTIDMGVFEIKRDAIKVAMNYMRTHPNG